MRISWFAPTWVSTSVTYALMSLWPSARATDTRWWPSFTKCMSPIRYTSIGGIALPLRCARLMRSQRSRTRCEVGRNARSNSRERSTVPTIESSGMVCSPSRRSPILPSAWTTSSNGRM